MQKFLSLTVYVSAVAILGCSGFMTSTELDSTLIIRDSPPVNQKVKESPATTVAPIKTPTTTTTTLLVMQSTTVLSVPPRFLIPLEEAKAQGLWGRPQFAGCVSKYGTPSPDWLGELFIHSSWPVASWDKLCRVIGCESNFNPQAYGGLRDRNGPRMMGLTQIDRKSWTSKWQSMGFTDMFDPAQNLEFAFWLYTTTRDNEDWNVWPADQWTCNRA